MKGRQGGVGSFFTIHYGQRPSLALFRKCNMETYPIHPDWEGVKTANK